MKSSYIHIPFCDKICSYCDFCKMLKNDAFIDKYLLALEKEIKEYYMGEVLETIYIGGGTPSALNINQLEKLFKILSVFKKSDNLEFTVEGNFENTDINKLKLYKKYGVNRLSFGLETTNKIGLELLDRDFYNDNIKKIIREAKELGFHNINVDLIYAYPSETIDDLMSDLDYVLSLDVTHISTYSLIIEDNTKLFIDGVNYIDEEMDAKMYETICSVLKNNNYDHYEISNFCRDGYSSKHNTVYWNNENYYGFGLGASSYIGNQRITNTRSFNKYISGSWRLDINEIDIKTNIEYQIMLNLRKSSGINLEEFKMKFNRNFFELYDCDELINDKLLIFDGVNLFIPEDKWYISNEIIIRLFGSEVYE